MSSGHLSTQNPAAGRRARVAAAPGPAGRGPRPDRVARLPRRRWQAGLRARRAGQHHSRCSHAGYGGGGVAIPTVPVSETIWPVAGDNTANIQAAIDKVSALPLDRDGFRGAVLLRAGYYRMATPVKIQASGVVLRGEGMGDTGTILIGTGTGRPRLRRRARWSRRPGAASAELRCAGDAHPRSPAPRGDAEGRHEADRHRRLRAGRRHAASRWRPRSGFKPGDTVIVRRIGNQEWINAVGMNGDTPASRWRPFNVEWDRVVIDVQGNTITVDAPITCAIEKRWGGGEVLQVRRPGRIEQGRRREPARACRSSIRAKRTTEYGNMDRAELCRRGVLRRREPLPQLRHLRQREERLGAECDGAALRQQHGRHAARRQVDHRAGLRVARADLAAPAAARRFTFALRGQLALVQRCHSDKGRHSFMTGQPTASGNVFLDCKATNPYSSSEPHEQWATAASTTTSRRR